MGWGSFTSKYYSLYNSFVHIKKGENMSTARDNRYDVNCSGNTCTTPEGETFTYDSAAGVVTTGTGESFPVSSTPDGMSNPVNIGDYIPGANGYIDVPVD